MAAPDYILPLRDVLVMCVEEINRARPMIVKWKQLALQLEYAIGELPPGWIAGQPYPTERGGVSDEQ
jgi:hypothetical protein